jgi:hypothetical protein
MRRILKIGVIVAAVAAVVYVVAQVAKSRRNGSADGAEGTADWPPRSEAEGEAAPAEPAGSWVEPQDGSCPVSHPVKAKLSSQIFHVPGGMNYDRTNADRCYATPEAAIEDGLRQSKI